MDCKRHIIILKREIKTNEISCIERNGNSCYVTFSNSRKEYSFNASNVLWLSEPSRVDISNCEIRIDGKPTKEITELWLFTHDNGNYYTAVYAPDETTGSTGVDQFSDVRLKIVRPVIAGDATTIFEYITECASLCTLGKDSDKPDKSGLLQSYYSKINRIDSRSVASLYLSRDPRIDPSVPSAPLYPFGSNASQLQAVVIALSNRLSVIQGPPGTGKTQTILNIIANLLVGHKSVLIVSSNNSATANIAEKLDKYGLGFVAATLGKKANQEEFVKNQPEINPDIVSWTIEPHEITAMQQDVAIKTSRLAEIYALQNGLAVYRQELAEVSLEKSHFDEAFPGTSNIHTASEHFPSDKVLKFHSQLTRLSRLHSEDDHRGSLNIFRDVL